MRMLKKCRYHEKNSTQINKQKKVEKEKEGTKNRWDKQRKKDSKMID